jgi:acetyl-CoA carboxylase carboxyl transferase subunit alpha
LSSYRLSFEEPVRELERVIEDLRKAAANGKTASARELKRLERKRDQLLKDIYSNLTPWQKVQVARHPERPSTSDYIRLILNDFQELHGDRRFGDDKAMICGLGTLNGIRLGLVGHHKGRATPEKIRCNFGMAHPEGYRKALRVVMLAEKFHLPVLALIDTPGAYPGVGAEERGQAYAIAENILEMSLLRTPIVGVVLGEGGSGGALGIGIADCLLMLQYAYYSVISPEGCAAILWRSAEMVEEAAMALKLGARDLLNMGLIDGIIEEPVGGAHRDPDLMARRLREAIVQNLRKLARLKTDTLLERRRRKYRMMGVFKEDGRLIDQVRLRSKPAEA